MWDQARQSARRNEKEKGTTEVDEKGSKCAVLVLAGKSPRRATEIHSSPVQEGARAHFNAKRRRTLLSTQTGHTLHQSANSGCDKVPNPPMQQGEREGSSACRDYSSRAGGVAPKEWEENVKLSVMERLLASSQWERETWGEFGGEYQVDSGQWTVDSNGGRAYLGAWVGADRRLHTRPFRSSSGVVQGFAGQSCREADHPQLSPHPQTAPPLVLRCRAWDQLALRAVTQLRVVTDREQQLECAPACLRPSVSLPLSLSVWCLSPHAPTTRGEA